MRQLPVQSYAEVGEVAIYNPDDSIRLEVRLEQETVWLDRTQISTLFARDKKTIGKHINTALDEELSGIPTVANFEIVQQEGNRWVKRTKEFFNLDMILSVGYRVHSSRGIAFRRWANSVLKDYLIRGYAINPRLEKLEKRVAKTEEKIDFFVKTALPPVEGIFFDGQIYDSYEFVCGLIRNAKVRIILIDNYVDETVLTMLDKRSDDVSGIIYTQQISHQLQLDLAKHNAQYAPIEVLPFNKAHDRFLIIDEQVYHIGASLKDLGKKWFAFSLMNDISSSDLLLKVTNKT
ncbi:MAG: virulence RhuM family protein [Bacteroidales bacterium]|nr:virulence RhuM family protein [Bacteroidales bacterium]